MFSCLLTKLSSSAIDALINVSGEALIQPPIPNNVLNPVTSGSCLLVHFAIFSASIRLGSRAVPFHRYFRLMWLISSPIQ